MPSVRCPSCKRLLNLRDELIGLDAKCPLCGAVFPAEPEGGRPMVYQRMPDAPDPSRPWRPAGQRDEPPVPTYPGPEPDPARRIPALNPLRRLGNWMFGLAITGLVWNMSCGCAGLLAVVGRGNRMREAELFLGATTYLLQLGSLLVILIAAQGMRTAGRSRGLAWTAVVLALCEGLFIAVRGVFLLAALDSPRLEEVTVGFNCVSLIVSGGLFLTGVWGLRLLARPAGQVPEDPVD